MTKDDRDFIRQNMYVNKKSKSVYSPFYITLWFIPVWLLLGYLYYNDTSNYENAENTSMPGIFWRLYEMAGKNGGLLIISFFAIAFIVLGYFAALERKKLKGKSSI